MAYSERRQRSNGMGRNGARRDDRTRIPPHVLRDLGTPRDKKSFPIWRTLFAVVALIALLVPGVAAAVGGIVYTDTAASLRPRLERVASYHDRAFQTSRIFDRNGVLLYEFVNEGRRDYVPLDRISDLVKEATISIEDKTFYENEGVDYVGLTRAMIQNIQSGEEVSGASTITQQLIKLLVLSDEERARENRYRRKITEIILAQQIGADYTKDQILELYLNEINYGNLSYGIQAAAKGYFGVNADELNLNQASLLAGLPQQPSLYNPINYRDPNNVLPGVKLRPGWLNPAAPLPNGIVLPRARQVDVLRQMVLNGKVSEREARQAIAQDLEFVSQDVAINAPHFVFYVREMLEKDPIVSSMLLNEGGLTITTTLDLRMQNMAQAEAKKRIEELEQEQRNIHNAAVVIQQPGTGQILAMVGSIDYNASKATETPGEEGNVLDGNVNVTTRERQPGSALKPFTYLSAINQGKLNAGSILWDVETRFPILAGASKANLDNTNYWYGPKNYDLRWHGPIRMRESLAGSLNMPAIKALKQAGVPETIDLLHRAGISGLRNPPDYYGLALTLGGGEVTALDLTTAYNTLANNGEYIPATPILKITDRNGNDLPYSAGQRRTAADPAAVAIVRDFMGDNEARVPVFGRNSPLVLSRPAHVKTGTTEDFRDAWAVGYTPYVTVGVWTGNNNNEKTAKVESTVGGGVIWNRIMENLFKDPEFERLLRGPDLSVPLEFPPPSEFGAEKRKICAIGGAFGKRTEEWFMPGQSASDTECDLATTIKVVRQPDGTLCRPVNGVNYGDRLISYKVWGAAPSSDEEYVISSKWDGGAGGAIAVAPEEVCGRELAVAPGAPTPNPNAPRPSPTTYPPITWEPDDPAPGDEPGQAPAPTTVVQQPVPQPTQAPVQQVPPKPQPTPVPAPPAATLPSLIGLGENQARAVLANLGVTSVVVDYQGADRLGDLFNQYPAYAVVSSSPGAGAPVTPGMTVVLGVRAP
jgi:membrane peptidoglycan carboxypeptidase